MRLLLIFSLLLFNMAYGDDLTSKVNIYIEEALKFHKNKQYREACNFYQTSTKMIESYKLQEIFDFAKLQSQKNHACLLADQDSKKKFDEANAQYDKLNSLLNSNPALKDQLINGDGLNCTQVRQKCQASNNYQQCMYYFNLNNPSQSLSKPTTCSP